MAVLKRATIYKKQITILSHIIIIHIGINTLVHSNTAALVVCASGTVYYIIIIYVKKGLLREARAYLFY